MGGLLLTHVHDMVGLILVYDMVGLILVYDMVGLILLYRPHCLTFVG